jgi:hypothetical protein
MAKSHIQLICLLLIISLILCKGVGISSSQELPASQKTYPYYSERLKEAEELLQQDYRVNPQDIQMLEDMLEELEDTPYKDLIAKARMLVFLTEEKHKAQTSSDAHAGLSKETDKEGASLSLQNRSRPDNTKADDTEPVRPRARRPGRGREIAQWITFGFGASCLGLFNLFWYMGDRTYEEYLSATSSSEEKLLEQITNTYDTLSYVFGGVGLVSIGVWIYLLATGPVDNRPSLE